MQQSITYAFGSFRLDTVTQILCNEESCISLTPKAYRLLLYFLHHSGRLISHEELFDRVWDGRIVEDSALRLVIYSLRKILGDESKSPHYIETVSKRGYRFLAVVVIKGRNQAAKASEIRQPDHRSKVPVLPTGHNYTQELVELHEAYQQASTGERRLVFLHGEHGIGKTALLNTFLANVQHSELAVLRARCVQMSCVAEPFLPLLEALERHCRESNGRLIIERLNQIAPTWLYQMLNVLDPDDIAKLQQKVSHIYTGRMLREGADFFERLSQNATLILMLDNAQWSDEFTLDLLNFLMFRCTAAKLLIIVSYRPCEVGLGVRRIAEMRAELLRHGLCQELSMQKCQS